MDFRALPPLALLRAFSAFADKGGVVAAGDALNVSHAAISQNIRKLELHLGTPLVARAGRELTLTAEGEILAEALRAGFGRIEQGVSQIAKQGSVRPVHITTTPAFASNWLIPRIAGFRAAHPEIELTLDPTPKLANIGPGGADIAVRFGSGNWPGLNSRLLMPSDYVLAAARTLVGDTAFTDLRQLFDYPWLHEEGHEELTTWLESEGVQVRENPKITRLPGYFVMDAMRRGEGLAGVSRTFIEDEIAAGTLRVLFSQGGENSGYHVVTPQQIVRPQVRVFEKWIFRQTVS